ncbi:unnamed protein product [Symbiodinium sp. KB8]|nr:unnamed protein product [Symbiodinium sp. KB8]
MVSNLLLVQGRLSSADITSVVVSESTWMQGKQLLKSRQCMLQVSFADKVHAFSALAGSTAGRGLQVSIIVEHCEVGLAASSCFHEHVHAFGKRLNLRPVM